MSLLPRRWRLRRLRDRLAKAERTKDAALQALIVRDQTIGGRPRYDFQDPGVVGSLLDEIKLLRSRIAQLDSGGEAMAEPAPAPAVQPPAPQPVAAQSLIAQPLAAQPLAVSPAAPVPPAPAAPLSPPGPAPHRSEEVVVDAAFHVLRTGLTQAQSSSGNGRIGVDALRDSLQAALASKEVLDAAFEALRAEMLRLQRTSNSSKIGLESLRVALRTALAADDPAPCGWDGSWPDLDRPGTPAEYARDGWHWVQAPGKPIVALSWNGDTRCWGHRTRIPPHKIYEDGVRYYGPCAPPVVVAPRARAAAESEMMSA